MSGKLPDGAPFSRIEFASCGAVPVRRELRPVAEWPVDSESGGRVSSCQNTQLKGLWAVFAAPDISGRDPEQLLRVVGKGRKLLLLSELLRPLEVGVVGFLDATIVSDVLPLSVDAVYLRHNEIIATSVYKDDQG